MTIKVKFMSGFCFVNCIGWHFLWVFPNMKFSGDITADSEDSGSADIGLVSFTKVGFTD